MPKGYFESWSDEHVRGYGDHVLHAADMAAATVGGWRTQNVRLGRHVLGLRSTDDRVHALLARAMGHLATFDVADVTISVCDAACTGATWPPVPSWAAETWRHDSPSTVLYQDRARGSLSYSDAERGVGVWWIADELSIPAWERPAPMRALIDRLLGPHGVTLVHGGVVGDDRGGVLLAGPGGSGKSTSVVACLAAGMSSGGDDFVLLHNDHRQPWVGFSMYATARLLPESPGWSCFNPSPDAIELPRALDSDDPNLIKRIVFLNEQFPGQVRTSFPLRAIAVPVVSDHVETRAVPLRPAAALRALAPSSMLQLVDPHRSALTTMIAMAGDLPCFELRVGSDVADVPRAVHDLLGSVTA